MDSEELFKEAREVWRAALRNHVLAPPDAGFSARLAALADAANQRAKACQAAAKDGYEWPAARRGAKPPYELQPGSGRRGPEELWEQFDDAVAELDRVSEGRSMRAVARAYADLANVAEALASAIAQEDQAAGLLPAKKKPAAAPGDKPVTVFHSALISLRQTTITPNASAITAPRSSVSASGRSPNQFTVRTSRARPPRASWRATHSMPTKWDRAASDSPRGARPRRHGGGRRFHRGAPVGGGAGV